MHHFLKIDYEFFIKSVDALYIQKKQVVYSL